jgi:hypothetical protein
MLSAIVSQLSPYRGRLYICDHKISASVVATITGKSDWKALTSTVNFGLDERPLPEESVVELPVAAP